MADDVVWVPVLPSMNNFGAMLARGAAGAGRQAGQAAGQGIADGIAGARAAVEKATSALAKSQDKVADSAGKRRIAEAALLDLQEKGITSGARHTRAVEALESARRRETAAANDARRAVDQLAAAEDRAANATDTMSNAAERSSGGFRSMFSGLDGGVKSLAGLAAGAAGVSGAMDLMGKAMEQEKSVSKLNASLGASGQMAKDFGTAAKGVFASGVGDSMSEVADAVGLVQSSFHTLGFEGDASLEQATTRAVNFANVFDADIASSVQAASTLVTEGLAKDSTEAFDLLTKSFQTVPAAMRDELPEIIQEYGTNFRALGFDGKESFNLLVSAAGQGKFALDKTGDALKEFTIRATDGSKSTAEAYAAIGADAGLMANDVSIGGDQAQYALQQTAEKLLAVEDPAKRAQLAIALFGTPLEDLSVDQIPAFLEGIAGAPDAMAEFAGATDQMGDTLNDNAAAKLETFKRGIESGIVGVLGEQALPMMSDFTGALEENEGSMLATIAGMTGFGGALAGMEQAKGVFDSVKEGAVGIKDGFMQAKDTATTAVSSVKSAASAVKSWNVGAKISSAVTKGWAAAQWVLNAAMNANPIGLIVIGIAALIAAAVLAYQKVDWFREGVQAAWEGIKTAASVAWESVLKPIFEVFMSVLRGVGDVVMWVWQSVIQPAFTAIGFVIDVFWAAARIVFELWKIYIGAVGDMAMWLWNTAIMPAFNGIAAVISAVWNGIIMPLFDLFKLGLSAIGDAAMWLWNNAVMPAWNGIGAAISAVYHGVILPVFDLWKAGVQAIGDVANWLYHNAILPAFDGVRSAISGAWDAVRPILGWIGDGIGALGSIASTVGDAMRTAFSGVVDILKAPARAIGGLLVKLPTKILGVDLPGVGQLHEWGASLQALRTGGVVAGRRATGQLTGPGTGTSDSILGVNANGVPIVRVSAGEGVVMNEAMENGGAELVALLNAGWRPPAEFLHALTNGDFRSNSLGVEEDSPLVAGVLGLRSMFDRLPKFAAGGRIDEAMDFARSMDPVGYEMGGFSTSSIDCSGFVAAVVNKALGLEPFSERMSTMNEGPWLAAKGAQSGMGQEGDLRIGWYDNGGGAYGHTAGTFPDGTNFESNGSEGVVIGGSTGYDDPMFTDHAFFPGSMFLGGDLGGGTHTADPSIFGSGNGGSGGPVGSDTAPPIVKGGSTPSPSTSTPSTPSPSSSSSSSSSTSSGGSMTLSDYVGQTASDFATSTTKDTLDFFGFGKLADLPIIPKSDTSEAITPATPPVDSDAPPAGAPMRSEGAPLMQFGDITTFDLEEFLRLFQREANHLVRGDAIAGLGGWSS